MNKGTQEKYFKKFVKMAIYRRLPSGETQGMPYHARP